MASIFNGMLLGAYAWEPFFSPHMLQMPLCFTCHIPPADCLSAATRYAKVIKVILTLTTEPNHGMLMWFYSLWGEGVRGLVHIHVCHIKSLQVDSRMEGGFKKNDSAVANYREHDNAATVKNTYLSAQDHRAVFCIYDYKEHQVSPSGKGRCLSAPAYQFESQKMSLSDSAIQKNPLYH